MDQLSDFSPANPIADAAVVWVGADGVVGGGDDKNVTFAPTGALVAPGLDGAAYSSIQDAINAAAPGDIIRVAPGTYNETVVITKSNLTILGPNSGVVGSGIRSAEAVVTGGFVLNGVSTVTISGFSVTGSNVPGSRGVLLGDTTAIPGPVTISNNIIGS